MSTNRHKIFIEASSIESEFRHLNEMGSLPNLNELCGEKTIRRTAEKELDMARERARQLEFNRDGSKNSSIKERLKAQFLKQHPHHHQHQQQNLPQTKHRHSLTGRKVHRTRSSGATHHIWDDPMIEHMVAYSPISTHRHRVNTAPSCQIASTSTSNSNAIPTIPTVTAIASGHMAIGCRRRESMNSSIGATSIRRLLTVNRACQNKVPVHVRAKVAKNFTLLIIAHGLTCAVYVPLFGLQASNSIWFHQESWLLRLIGPNVGPLLIGICFLITSLVCLFTNRIVRKIDCVTAIIVHYAMLCLFLLAHLYPTVWLLLPAYILFGLTLGPAWICKWNLVVFFASRLSCGQHECSTVHAVDTTTPSVNNSSGGGGNGAANDEHGNFCHRSQRIRRLARCFHAVQDIGILIGAIVAAFILACAATESDCFHMSNIFNFGQTNVNDTHNNNNNNQLNGISNQRGDGNFVNNMNVNDLEIDLANIKSMIVTNQTNNLVDFLLPNYDKLNDDTLYIQNDILQDNLYEKNERGLRICGADSCPIWNLKSFDTNRSEEYNWFTYSGTIPMTIVYLVFAIVAFILTYLMQHVDNTFRLENFKCVFDTFIFAAPLAFFIGIEQAYVLGGFTRAFVSCSLGAQMVAGSLIGLGLMQFIVSCTLSMLLRHTKRCAVLVAAFFFQACLLLVLSRWKPSTDDSALFYVIAAAWGACNGIWETLIFALVTLTHPNHIIEISSLLQACRFFGCAITFFAQLFLCENQKILILFILLVISVIPYSILEIRLESRRKTHSMSI